MSQFGPQHGPDIINYMKRQVAFEDTSIEPAWQAPPIPVAPAIPGRRPRIRPATRLPEIERSPSPENGASIWGPTNKQRDRGPKFTKKDDELLLDFVAEARRRGLYISSQLTWQQLEAAVGYIFFFGWKSNSFCSTLTTSGVLGNHITRGNLHFLPLRMMNPKYQHPKQHLTIKSLLLR